MDIFSIITLLGGLALFMYGMDTMGSGLKNLAGGKLESILSKLTSNRFKGFLLGFFVTAVIQSSSATMVMLVGFVNSGIMRFGQTISITMGANVGTTVTAWLISLSGISGDVWWIRIFNPSTFTPVLAFVGVAMAMLCKTDKKKNVGSILLGFAILMFGMETMSGSMEGLKDNDTFKSMLVMFSNPVMGILMGMIFTVIIQSSSASIGVLQALSTTGAISYSTAIPTILGMNIGTAITAILSSISGNAEAKKVAVSCVYIKIIGVVVVSGIFYALSYAMDFAFMSQSVDVVTIAIVHTVFNILSTIILFPFSKVLEKITNASIKTVSQRESDVFDTLDDRFFDVPTFAVENCRQLVCNMAQISRDSILASTKLISNYDEEVVKKINENEDEVDRYEDKVSTYLVRLSSHSMPDKDSRLVTELLHVIGDVERISDHSVNISEVAKEIHDKEIVFSEDAQHDIEIISDAVCHVLNLATDALVYNDLEIAKKVEPLEQVVDKLKRQIKNNHIERLKDGGCTVELGFVLSDLLTNYERIADHCSNIAVCLIELSHGSFETHEYLNHVKSDGGDAGFAQRYDKYKKKYSIQ